MYEEIQVFVKTFLTVLPAKTGFIFIEYNKIILMIVKI